MAMSPFLFSESFPLQAVPAGAGEAMVKAAVTPLQEAR